MLEVAAGGVAQDAEGVGVAGLMHRGSPRAGRTPEQRCAVSDRLQRPGRRRRGSLSSPSSLPGAVPPPSAGSRGGGGAAKDGGGGSRSSAIAGGAARSGP